MEQEVQLLWIDGLNKVLSYDGWRDGWNKASDYDGQVDRLMGGRMRMEDGEVGGKMGARIK